MTGDLPVQQDALHGVHCSVGSDFQSSDARKRKLGGPSLAACVTVSWLTFLLCGCDTEPRESRTQGTRAVSPTEAQTRPRWYTSEQVAAGAAVYRENCASCHKDNAEGTPEWRQRNVNGVLPPPPLNGTAHAWHHPLSVLRMVVKRGGAPVGGTMPAFQDKLTDEQVDAVIAWVQSHWPEDIYAHWLERDTGSRSGLQSVR